MLRGRAMTSALLPALLCWIKHVFLLHIMSCKAFNCSIHAHHELEPKPDISGIGLGDLLWALRYRYSKYAKVVIGFVASGWTTLLVLVLRYVAASSNPSTDDDAALLDSSLRKAARRILGIWPPPLQWVPTLETVRIRLSSKTAAPDVNRYPSSCWQ